MIIKPNENSKPAKANIKNDKEVKEASSIKELTIIISKNNITQVNSEKNNKVIK